MRRQPVGLLLLALSGLACATTSPPVPDASTGGAPLAAYVLLVESPSGAPAAMARVIVPAGAACPRLTGDASPIATTPRLNPHGFSVGVCEAEVPFGQALAVAGSTLTLPAATAQVAKVAVLGDTGCKPSDQAGCALDDPEWPFPALAAAAAAEAPDLVVHVGDYNYRGTPSSFERTVGGQQVKTWYYDAGDGAEPSSLCETVGPYWSQNWAANPDAEPDAWDAWWLDFFQPAAPLLAAAPWVFSRGNHELCSHAGPGWLYFLGPASLLPAGGGTQTACPAQDPASPVTGHLVFVPPQVLALGGVTLVVLDSANACDDLPNFVTAYDAQLAQAAQRVGAADPVWLLGHRPPWGVDGTSSGTIYGCDGQPRTDTQPYGAINVTLQCALAAPGGLALLPKLDLSLAGHMHRYEQLAFAAGSGRPPQVVAGNGGVAEETDPPVGAFAQTVDGEAASGFTVDQFGFLLMSRGTAGAWSGAVVTPDPAAWSAFLPACGTTAGAPLCVEGLP